MAARILTYECFEIFGGVECHTNWKQLFSIQLPKTIYLQSKEEKKTYGERESER